MNILVVEDTPIAQLAVRGMLTQMGHNVTIAADGYEAIKVGKENKYDFIFMDIGLGEGKSDGFQVTEEMKKEGELNCNTPIVALTAHTEDSYRIKAMTLGMVDYLTKPLMKETIVRVLSEHVK